MGADDLLRKQSRLVDGQIAEVHNFAGCVRIGGAGIGEDRAGLLLVVVARIGGCGGITGADGFIDGAEA